MTAPPASAGSPQATVAAAAAYLDSAARGLDQAAAALRAIPWGVDPPPPPPPPPPVTSLASGYNPDNSPNGIDSAGAIGAWRGAALSAYNVFQYGHKSRQAFADSISKPGWTPFRTVPILAHTGVLPILTIPGSVGDTAPDIPYSAVANGALDAEHRANAQFIAASGPWRTDVALRFARECDTLGSWYYGDTPAERAQWARAIAHLFNDLYAPVLPRAVLVVCVTKRGDDTRLAEVLAALDVPKVKLVVSIDAYWNKPYVDTPQGFADNWRRFVDPKVDQALKLGAKVAFSEYAVTDVDQPGNVQRGHEYLAALARDGKLHHCHYFGNTDKHALYGQTKFPKSAAAYREWWKGRA